MSHFTVLVIGNDPEALLEPFDENTVMDQYVRYTKEQLIENFKKQLEGYKNGYYAEYLADPAKYIAESNGNEAHIKYISEEFPQRLLWTDQEIYDYVISDYEEEDITEEGGVYSTYNPDSKWDWYQLGGRWSGMIKLKEGAIGEVGEGSLMCDNEAGIDQALKKDIANLSEIKTFAVIKDGKWYEKGQMGWWAIVRDAKEEADWDAEIEKLLADVGDDELISIYDCHI